MGVRRPFSRVKGSGTKVTALTNSNPLSWRPKMRQEWDIIDLNYIKIHGDIIRRPWALTLASLPMASNSARTAALALGSLHSCSRCSYCEEQEQMAGYNSPQAGSILRKSTTASTLIPFDDAQPLKTSWSTEITATRLALKLSPVP